MRTYPFYPFLLFSFLLAYYFQLGALLLLLQRRCNRFSQVGTGDQQQVGQKAALWGCGGQGSCDLPTKTLVPNVRVINESSILRTSVSPK